VLETISQSGLVQLKFCLYFWGCAKADVVYAGTA
jgi:hypothetical protein